MLVRMSVGIVVLAMTVSFAIGAASTASAGPEVPQEPAARPPSTPQRPPILRPPPNLGAIQHNLDLIRDSARSTDNDPVLFADEVTTTCSVKNPDGSRTVTTKDASGKVIDEYVVSTDPKTGDRTTTVVNPDGSKTVTTKDPKGKEVSVVTVPPPEPAAEEPNSTWTAADIARYLDADFDEWIERRARELAREEAEQPEAPADTASSVPPPTSDWQRADDELIDMEEELRDLKREHNDLLDEAVNTLDAAVNIEDIDEFEELVKKAQKVFEEWYELLEEYGDMRSEAIKSGWTPPTPIQDDGLPPFSPSPYGEAVVNPPAARD